MEATYTRASPKTFPKLARQKNRSFAFYAPPQKVFLTLAALLCVPSLALATCWSGTAPNVLTGQYDSQRTGVNGNETCLTPSASYTNFKNQGSYATDGAIYAQPLYVSGVTICGVSKNMLVVATLNDSVYAFDADSLTASVLWTTRNFATDCGTLGTAIPTPIATLPKAGVLSTPVVDKAAALIYVVGGCQDTSSHDRWYLHALVLTTGADITGYPIQITGSVLSSNGAVGAPSCGVYPATGCTLLFDEKYQLQRPALLQAKNAVSGVNEIYVGFGISSSLSEKDALNSYHGWLFGYNAGSTSAQLAFATTPTGRVSNSYTPACSNPFASDYSNWCGHGGGIWKNFAVDASSANIFLGSGNGGYQSGGYNNWGETEMKFAVNGSASPGDSFTTSNLTTLNSNDQDMGTSGQLLFQANVGSTGKALVVTFDKTGQGYVLYQSALGGYLSGDTGAESKFIGAYSGSGGSCDGTSPYSNYGTPPTGKTKGCDSTHHLAFYNNTLFHWPTHEDPDMCAWSTTAGTGFVCYPAISLSGGVFPVGAPGGILAVTADPGHPTANPVLWAIITGQNNLGGAIPSYTGYGRGYLYAYSATLPTTSAAGSLSLLYNTPTSGSSTDKWLASPFAVPTVVNGKVYVPTYDSGVVVYY